MIKVHLAAAVSHAKDKKVMANSSQDAARCSLSKARACLYNLQEVGAEMGDEETVSQAYMKEMKEILVPSQGDRLTRLSISEALVNLLDDVLTCY